MQTKDLFASFKSNHLLLKIVLVFACLGQLMDGLAVFMAHKEFVWRLMYYTGSREKVVFNIVWLVFVFLHLGQLGLFAGISLGRLRSFLLLVLVRVIMLPLSVFEFLGMSESYQRGGTAGRDFALKSGAESLVLFVLLLVGMRLDARKKAKP